GDGVRLIEGVIGSVDDLPRGDRRGREVEGGVEREGAGAAAEDLTGAGPGQLDRAGVERVLVGRRFTRREQRCDREQGDSGQECAEPPGATGDRWVGVGHVASGGPDASPSNASWVT